MTASPSTSRGRFSRYGVLLALAEPELIVAQASENVGDHLPLGIEDILGQPLSNIIDAASVDELREALREERWYESEPVSHQCAWEAIRRDHPSP